MIRNSSMWRLLLLIIAIAGIAAFAFAAQVEKDTYMAGFHQANGVSCVDCHEKNFVMDDSETVVNKKCVECHGSMSDMAKVTAKDELNPHKSHLGEINCSTCHKGHEQSKAYCNNCHTFKMDIKFDSDKKAEFADSADVVVVGAGGAGYVAAISAADAGAKVILLDRMPITGGNSSLAAGGINAAETSVQKKQGIKDDKEAMVEETIKGGRYLNDVQLVKTMVYNSAAAIDWLISIGADMSDIVRSGGVDYDRTHRPVGGGAVGTHLISVYKANAIKKGIDVRVNSDVVKIIKNDKGAVVGVQVKGKHSGLYTIKAKAVVVAAGGFAASDELVAKYKPQFKNTPSSNQPGATGGGIKILEDAGAEMIDMGFIQIHPTMGGDTKVLISETVRGSGAILVNQEGKRFVNELTTRDKATAAILKQTGAKAYLIFGEEVRKANKQVNGYIHLNLVESASNLKDLAKKIDVPADVMADTVAKYNSYYTKKADPEFSRQDMPRPIKEAQYYAIMVKPGRHHTMGGARINTNSQVINLTADVIPGLFAAGEVTGGVQGGNRLGGNAITDTMVFGRIAGANAASYAASVK